MQGHFDLTMFNTPGLTQDLIEAVRREGGDPAVEHYLRKFAKEGEWKTGNLVYQVTPSYLYYWALGALTVYGSMSSSTTGGSNGLGFINLSSTSAEPTYNGENYAATPTWITVPDSVGAGSSKHFWTAAYGSTGPIVTPDVKVDANGREAIYMKTKWLYLPGEATSSVIRSVGVYYSDGLSDYAAIGYAKVRLARVRIKDSGGNPVTISKIATKSLLVEYTFTMPTL
jgi:hypothetical protein